jgi:hypothetical protein
MARMAVVVGRMVDWWIDDVKSGSGSAVGMGRINWGLEYLI